MPSSRSVGPTPPVKILVTGPESSGKTTLARDLACRLGGVWVPEFARPYLEEHGPEYEAADLPRILRGQLASEDAAAAAGARLLVCDTGPEVLHVWWEEKYGTVAPEIAEAFFNRNYELTLLCYPEYPWAPDPLREHPEEADRVRLFARYLELLAGSGKNYFVLHPNQRPPEQSQLEQAVDIASRILATLP